jgi:Protein of unknown function (DUF4232)
MQLTHIPTPSRSAIMPSRFSFPPSAVALALLAAAPAVHAVPAAHLCAAADVQVSAGPAGAWRGQATQEIRITNTGSDACVLPGFPGLQLQPASEAPQTVGASEQAPQLGSARVELAPGEEAVVLLGTPGSCEAANKPERKVSRRLQLALAGGGVKALDGLHIDTLCGRATVLRFERVQSEAAARTAALKTAGAISQLTGSLSAPDEASRGDMLHYTVTLTNPTASPVSLAACPAYTQSVYADGKSADTTQRLDCAAAGGRIPANASVSFEMQVQVPAGLAAGSGKLSWKLDGGPGVGKIIGLR